MEKNKLFAELNGFVIYNPFLLERYLEENSLYNKDVLAYITETEHGDIITRNGIAVPLIGLPDDDYRFYLQRDKTEVVTGQLIKSTGWVYNARSGEVRVVGIGYFKDIDSIDNDNSLLFNLTEGWKKLTIYSVLQNQPGFVMNFEDSLTQPVFSGNVETNYGFDGDDKV
jgi:hypothetical protein